MKKIKPCWNPAKEHAPIECVLAYYAREYGLEMWAVPWTDCDCIVTGPDGKHLLRKIFSEEFCRNYGKEDLDIIRGMMYRLYRKYQHEVGGGCENSRSIMGTWALQRVEGFRGRGADLVDQQVGP